MGMFGSRKETYVSSVVYNMAGDEMDRPNFLKTTLYGSTIGNRKLSENIVNSYLQGPGMRFKSFAKWARRTNYDDVVGLVTGSIKTGNSIDQDALADEIVPPVGSSVKLITATIGPADYTYWADQHVSINYPNRLLEPYETDYLEDEGTIKITWQDNTETYFLPDGFDIRNEYIYATYNTVAGNDVRPVVEGDVIELGDDEEFPSTAGWTAAGEEVVDDTTFTFWERTTYMGQAPDRDATYTLFERMIFAENAVEEAREYRVDTQKTYHSIRSPIRVFIYGKGTGNAVLDSMFVQSQVMDNFFPYIPFRLDNKFIGPDYLPNVYAQAKKAYKKATTGNYDKMIKDLADNESIGDIDFAYQVFGVSLNVLENTAKEYVYRFFQEILNDYSEDGSYDSWKLAWQQAENSQAAWAVWRTAQNDENDPLYGTPEPTQIPYPQRPIGQIRISSDRLNVMNYDMLIRWSAMKETVGTGVLRPGAKKGDVWLSAGMSDEFQEYYWAEQDGVWKRVPSQQIQLGVTYINWQTSPTTWRRIQIDGLEHVNMVYGGKSVTINAKEALEDPEESGFIIPLHEGIYHSMGMKNSTQMATACSFMVFNCYQVVKKKWYQTGIFKVILVIVIVVVAYFTMGASLGASAGVLGTNAAVGAAIIGAGASAAAIAIVGAVANAIAALLLTKLITAGATALFGEKWGAIIGAIASVIALQVGSAVASGQSMASGFSNLMRAENLLKLTSAVGQGYQGYVAGAMQQMAAEQQRVMEEYQSEAREIRQQWVNTFGTDRGIIDPADITDAFGVTMESVDAFLQRTLMTGSDVADMSLDLLTNFVDMTLNTDLPI